MKITFAFSALVAMAATVASAAPANSGISVRADPCRDSTLTRYTFYPKGISAPEGGILISWELYIKDRIRETIPYQQYNGGTITRMSSDKKWSVKHKDTLWGVTLKIKGGEHQWNKVSRSSYDSASKMMTSEYFTCIPWK